MIRALTTPTSTTLALCLLGAATLAACSSDPIPPNAQTADNNSAENNSDGNNAENNGGNNASNSTSNNANSQVNNQANNANNGATNNTANNTANNADPGRCTSGGVGFIEPAPDDTVAPQADQDPAEPGLQVDVRLFTDLTGELIVTVENTTTGESWGASGRGPELVVEGVRLVEGENALVATADSATCFVEASASVTAQPGTPCAQDAQCPDGSLCEEGLCAACDAECSSDAECGGGTCVQGCFCTMPYRYVLIEDLYAGTGGNTPGADVDAVGLTRSARSEIFASRVEDARIVQQGNNFADPSALLGPPDADCQVQNFVSLGGREAGAYVIVSFNDGGPVALQVGDTITVYEIGQLTCPGSPYQDEPYAVSVSVATPNDTFVELGQGGPGRNTITINQLP